MKRAVSLVGTIFAYLLFVGMFILLLPFTLTAILVISTLEWYGKLWQRIRHDPVREITIDGIFDPEWAEVNSREGYVEAYKRVSDAIAKLSSAEKSEIQYDGFDVFDNPDTKLQWNDLAMLQTLTTQYAKVRLSLEFGVKIEDNEFYVSEEEYDERSSFDGFPDLIAEIIEPKSLLRKKRTLRTYQDIWVIVAILRGDVKRTRRQLWVQIPEYEIWMVEYKINGSDYGYRLNFANGTTRKYWFDEKMNV